MDSNSIMSVLKTANTGLVWVMRAVIIMVTAMATCTMLLQVVARYVFEISISGLDELTGHTAVWLYLMGAAYGTYDRSQIKAEMVHLFVKNQRILSMIKAATCLVSVVISCYMTVWSWGYVQWSMLKHEITPTLQIPAVIFQSAILAGAVMMLLYFFVEFTDAVKSAVSGDPDAPAANALSGTAGQ